ncbi:MAG: hypothetical protein Unbinned4139contig1000_35 [Prokaryotic dsDNA virus sp.]|nr:MAG: hypothetical protein Unbinned4139contig1000_35 [Prokaryotic dsDNA virus sp.]|tara:strand:+ start:5225 stop:5752 length:528 start_codon:yes stop_codon:yes gene_type:complete
MSEETKSDTTQEAQETVAKNDQNTSSDDGLLQELMKYKSQRNELRDEIESYKAKEEKRRTAKLEEEGKYKELLAEQSSTIDNLNAKLESQTGIVNNYKQNLINGLASDNERKEYLSTKSVDFLEELTKEKNAMQQDPIVNPKESLGAVRSPILNKNYADMTEAERKKWHEQTFKR